MITADRINNSTARLDEVLAKRPAVQTSNDPNAAYKSLDVIKRLNKAKFPVYLASSKVTKQNFAMKLFSFNGDKPHPYFKNEARFAILKHPNVINIVYTENEKDTLSKGQVNKVSYLLLEFAPHGDFFDFVTKYRDSLDEKLVRTFFRQLISGIEYLHASKVAHLDLKPENLLVGADCNLKIADFDLSYVVGDEKLLGKGTKYYRGPEFFKCVTKEPPQLKDPFKSDIYAAGVILFVMKCGGIYPHSENDNLGGMNFCDIMYKNNNEFWKQHCEVQEKKSSFFDREFKELFNAMVKYNPEDRISIEEIKKSKWYNGSVYTPVEFQRLMKKILKC